MTEYIERDALQATLVRKQCGPANKRYTEGWNDCLMKVKSMVSSAPAADVAPVVRCKDCKHCRELNRKNRAEEAYADGILWCRNQSDGVWPDDFCSYGERKEDGDAGNQC